MGLWSLRLCDVGQTGLLLGAVQISAGDSAPTAQTQRATVANTTSCIKLTLTMLRT